ncbi:hypothetical protein [uncultured Tateyamaria sp.]|uniref:hypothetical protein n=1 Tax=uncultured Tateyamaria sp. TaxID=455651 RepID=UPI00262BA093|nr:hypothetical protein [uncultured Tateyamaria sp.]
MTKLENSFPSKNLDSDGGSLFPNRKLVATKANQMKLVNIAAAIAVALSLSTGQVEAKRASDAAKCATYSYANLDYERNRAGIRQIDPGRIQAWENQANAFINLAVARGMSQSEVIAFIAKYRSKYETYVHEFKNDGHYDLKASQRLFSSCRQLARRTESVPEVK